MSELDDIDLSFYESAAGSELQEIEANSEFEIAWGSVKKARLLMESNSVGEESDSSSTEDLDAVPMVKVKEGSGIEDISSQMKTLEKTVSNSSDTSLPKHRDFTEQELKDLMQRKGMLSQTESSDNVSNELESLKEHRVTDNPLFYFFQRNPDQNPWKAPEQDEEETSDFPTPEDKEEDKIEKENPLSYLFEQPDHASGKPQTDNPLGHLFQQSSKLSPGDGTSDNDISHVNTGLNNKPSSPLSLTKPTPEDTEHGVDFSQFDHAVVKAAKEYKAGDDCDEDEDFDGDDDVDDDDNVADDDEIDEDIRKLCISSAVVANETEITNSMTLVQPGSAVLDPDLEITQFDHAVCKPAKEYSSDDDGETDDEEEEEEDGDEEGDDDVKIKADKSVPSDDEQVPEAMQNEKDLAVDVDILFSEAPPDVISGDDPVYNENTSTFLEGNNKQNVHFTSEEKDLSPDDDILFPEPPPDVIPDPPPDVISEEVPAYSECTFSAFLRRDSKNVGDAASHEYDDESEAVDDLLSLAEMESTKALGFSGSDTQDEPQTLVAPPAETRAIKPKTDNPADRLNSLLEEVSSLVNNSRFLQGRKTSRSREDTNKPSSVTKPNDGQIQNPPIINDRVLPNNADVFSVSPKVPPEKEVQDTTVDCMSSIKHPDTNLDSSKIQNHDVRSLPRGKKSKVNSAINFYSGLDSKKSKSDDLTGALRRSRGEVNLAHIGQSNDKHQRAKDLFEPFHSESTISSIFRVEQDQHNRFQSPKVKHHPHEHPHRQRSSSDLEETDNSFRRGRKVSSDDAENDSSFQRSQRDSSVNRGKVLASVQNFERLSTSSSSFNSNYSSSVGGSFRQTGSPKLVLISDVGLNVSGNSENQQIIPANHHELRDTSSDLRSHDQVDHDAGEYDEEVFTVEEKFMTSKSGKVKPSRSKKSYRPAVLHQMEGYIEREDFV